MQSIKNLNNELKPDIFSIKYLSNFDKYSFILPLFYTIYSTTEKCECGTQVKYTDHTCMTIDITKKDCQILNDNNISNVINNAIYNKWSKNDTYNSPHNKCKTCNYSIDYKTIKKIWLLPKILIVNISRNVNIKDVTEKDKYKIIVDENIDLEQSYGEKSPYSDKRNKYKLFALNLHSGNSAVSGHYISVIKVKNKWYKYDDMSNINEFRNYVTDLNQIEINGFDITMAFYENDNAK
jgi:ubiquitin C-terminal hydrolase